MWHDVIVYFLSVDICLLHSVANCLPHVLSITYFMCCRHSLLHCCRHCLLHCVAVIAYFIMLPSLLTSSLQCRQHYLRCCLLLVLAYKRGSDLIHCNTFFIYLSIFLFISIFLIIILH